MQRPASSRSAGRPTSAFGSPLPSSIPRPENNNNNNNNSGNSSTAEYGLSESRKRQSKRDEGIRQKMEKDLAKKRPNAARSRQTKNRAAPGTVSSLRPTPPLTVPTDITVHEAAQLMAAKREDCVLVVDGESHLAGIFTAKDLAFRVVAKGLSPSSTLVSEIMTEQPMCTRVDTSATEALDLMVSRGFRHLPVVDEEGDVCGVLDITRCFHEAMEKLERAYSSSKRLYEALEGVHHEMGGGAGQQPAQIIEYVETIRQKMSGPDLASVLSKEGDEHAPTWVTVKTSVRDAAALMRENHTTAVLVMEGATLAGIFTSKDVVLRVIAPGLDPGVCSVVRVMTPHPDCAPQTLSIQAALRKMNDGRYLNLPVMDEEETIVGMVDVLKLTYATLEQVHSISATDGEGPMWNRFWASLPEDEQASVTSDSFSQSRGGPPMIEMESDAMDGGSEHNSNNNSNNNNINGNNVKPADSVSLVLQEETELPCSFKFKAPLGKVHRFAVLPSGGLPALRAAVLERLGKDGKADFHLSYVDEDGDQVSLTGEADLLEAVAVSRKAGRDKVDLQVAATSTLATPSTLTTSGDHVPVVQRKVEQQAQAQVTLTATNMLIPGAIAVLAVAGIAAFAIRR